MNMANKDSDYVTQSQWAEGMEMIKDYFGKLEFIMNDSRKEQRQTNKEMRRDIELNTDSLSALTEEIREVKKLEFTVYNHERRITKLEKSKTL